MNKTSSDSRGADLRGELVARARDLVPLLAKNATQTETDRRVVEENLQALILIGPQLGLAKAALDFVISKASKRGISYTSYDSQVNAPTVQLAISEAAMLVDTAHLHAYRAAADIDDAARANRWRAAMPW